jgi:hypothetical protein
MHGPTKAWMCAIVMLSIKLINFFSCGDDMNEIPVIGPSYRMAQSAARLRIEGHVHLSLFLQCFGTFMSESESRRRNHLGCPYFEYSISSTLVSPGRNAAICPRSC